MSIPTHVKSGTPGRRMLSLAAVPLIMLLAGCGSGQPALKAQPKPAPAKSTTPDQAKPQTRVAKQTPAEKPGAAIDVLKAQGLAAKVKAERGKVVVVNFWATWCAPCVHELPELAKFYKQLDPQKVVFVSASADAPETIDDVVKPFVAKRKLPFPIHVVDATPDQLAKALDMGDWEGTLPATFIYDQEGKLRKSWVKETTAPALEAAIKPLLNGS